MSSDKKNNKIRFNDNIITTGISESMRNHFEFHKRSDLTMVGGLLQELKLDKKLLGNLGTVNVLSGLSAHMLNYSSFLGSTTLTITSGISQRLNLDKKLLGNGVAGILYEHSKNIPDYSSILGSSAITALNKALKGVSYDNKLFSSLSGVSMITELSKNLSSYYKTIENSNIISANSILKGVSINNRFAIPQHTIDSIISISSQHAGLLEKLGGMVNSLKIPSIGIAQINSLNYALGDISRHIAKSALQQQDWSLIDDFKEVNEKSIEFSENLSSEITLEQQREFKNLLSFIYNLVNKHKKKGSNVVRFLEIIVLFYGLPQIFLPKAELALKSDISQTNLKQDTIIHYLALINEELKGAKEYRITRSECQVKLKPQANTLIISNLPKGFELVVLQVNHKWVLVSFFDPKDNLAMTGWVLKKKLDTPK